MDEKISPRLLLFFASFSTRSFIDIKLPPYYDNVRRRLLDNHFRSMYVDQIMVIF